MGMDTHKGRYAAYKERHKMDQTQQLILHHLSRPSGDPLAPSAPTNYAHWNSSSGLNYGELERHLFPTMARESIAPSNVEGEDIEEYDDEDGDEEDDEDYE